MNALGIIGMMIAGGGLGCFVSTWWGERRTSDDFGFVVGLYGLYGALLGSLAGVIVGSVIFA